MSTKIRLDKFLTEMNLGTRSQIKEAARKGRVSVNGETEKASDRKIDPIADEVFFDGVRIAYTSLEYYMLNKPQGVVSATEDNLYKTVLTLLTDKKRKDLFPVGRLDIDTEGLLLITNDGDLAHRLLTPKKHVDKTYYAVIQGQLPLDVKEQFEHGIVLSPVGLEKDNPGEIVTMPAKLEVLESGMKDMEVLLTIQEGRFHQVKRMFEVFGCRVSYLKRLSMGSLVLDESLKPGEYRELTTKELEGLKELG